MCALFCLLFLLFASTAQACHNHDAPASQSSRGALTQDHCSLCVAMHSALPTTMHAAPNPVLRVQDCLTRVSAVEPETHWSFNLFGRPPPAPVAAHV